MKIVIEVDVWIKEDMLTKGTVAIHLRPENAKEMSMLEEIYENISGDIGYSYGYPVFKVGMGEINSEFEVDNFDDIVFTRVEILLGIQEGSLHDMAEFIEQKLESAEEIAQEVEGILEEMGITSKILRRYYPHIMAE